MENWVEIDYFNKDTQDKPFMAFCKEIHLARRSEMIATFWVSYTHQYTSTMNQLYQPKIHATAWSDKHRTSSMPYDFSNGNSSGKRDGGVEYRK